MCPRKLVAYLSETLHFLINKVKNKHHIPSIIFCPCPRLSQQPNKLLDINNNHNTKLKRFKISTTNLFPVIKTKFLKSLKHNKTLFLWNFNELNSPFIHKACVWVCVCEWVSECVCNKKLVAHVYLDKINKV